MGARYGERVRDAAYSFLGHATSGIAARCAVINTDMADSLLPTTWHLVRHGKDRVVRLPVCRIKVLESDVERERRPGNQPYHYVLILALGVGMAQTRGNPETEELVFERLERVLREIFEERDTWAGQTMGGRVQSARLMTVTNFSPASIEELDNERAVVCGARVDVIAVESRTATA